MKNKLNSVDTRGNFKEEVNFRWKHLQAMGFLEPYVKLTNDPKMSNDSDSQLNGQGDSDSQQFMGQDDDDGESSMNIKQEMGLSDSTVQDSFEAMQYCAVGLQNTVDIGTEEVNDEVDEIAEEPVKMDNLSLMYQERRRGRPRKRGIVAPVLPVISTPVLKKRRGRPKGYSPLKKAKYLQEQQMIQQKQSTRSQMTRNHYQNRENAYYNNHAATNYLQLVEDSTETAETIGGSLIPPPQLHKIPTELTQSSHHKKPTNAATSTASSSSCSTSTNKYTPNGQPATSTTAELSKDQQESDHMAQILMSMLHRIENPYQRTEVFIQMLTLCKNYMQVN